MEYFRSTITGKIVTGNFVDKMADIYGDDLLGKYIIDKILVHIDPPDVIDCLKYDSISVAVVRYQEIHPEVTWDEAWKMVKKIQKDILYFQSKEKEEINNGTE